MTSEKKVRTARALSGHEAARHGMIVVTGRFRVRFVSSLPLRIYSGGVIPNERGKEQFFMKKFLCNPRYLLAIFIVSGIVLLAGLVFLSPYQGPVVAYKLALVMVAAIAGMAFDFLAFPYALPSSYLDRDWREDPDAAGEDGQPDFPIATGYFRPFCAAMLRRACIIAAFVLAVALGL